MNFVYALKRRGVVFQVAYPFDSVIFYNALIVGSSVSCYWFVSGLCGMDVCFDHLTFAQLSGILEK